MSKIDALVRDKEETELLDELLNAKSFEDSFPLMKRQSFQLSRLFSQISDNDNFKSFLDIEEPKL